MVDPNRVGEPAQQEFAQRWGGAGSIVDLDGPVHWVEYGEETEFPPVVMVHGLGGSHLNWVRIAPVLAERTRVLTVDLPGSGSARPDDAAQGRRQREGAAPFLRDVVGRPVI